MGFVGAPEFTGGFDCQRLLNLAQVQHVVEGVREAEITREHLGDDAVTTGVFLMLLKGR